MPVLFLFPSFFFASWVPGPVRPSMDDSTIRWMTESFLISFFLHGTGRWWSIMDGRGEKGAMFRFSVVWRTG